MPQRDSIVVLTPDEAALVNTAIDAGKVKEAIKALTDTLKTNSGTIKNLSSGPRSAAEFKEGLEAAQESLKLIQALPTSDDRDELVVALEKSVSTFSDGVNMHDGHGH